MDRRQQRDREMSLVIAIGCLVTLVVTTLGWFLHWRGVEGWVVLAAVGLTISVAGLAVLFVALSYRRRLRDQGKL